MRLSSAQLVEQMSADLETTPVVGLNRSSPKPARLLVAGEGLMYFYLWNLSESKAGTRRPEGELKLQIKIPGYRVGARQSIAHDDAPAVIGGFYAPAGAYCLWDARQRPFPAYSANLQAKRSLCELAADRGAFLEVLPPSRRSISWRLYVSRRQLEPALRGLRRHCLIARPEDTPETLHAVGVHL